MFSECFLVCSIFYHLNGCSGRVNITTFQIVVFHWPIFMWSNTLCARITRPNFLVLVYGWNFLLSRLQNPPSYISRYRERRRVRSNHQFRREKYEESNETWDAEWRKIYWIQNRLNYLSYLINQNNFLLLIGVIL